MRDAPEVNHGSYALATAVLAPRQPWTMHK